MGRLRCSTGDAWVPWPTEEAICPWQDPEHVPDLDEAPSASVPVELPGILPLGTNFTRAPLRFEDCAGWLGEDVGDHSGAFVVDQRWVDLMAALPAEQRPAVARQWIIECDPGLKGDPTANESATEMLGQICEVCADSRTMGKPLVCAWYM